MSGTVIFKDAQTPSQPIRMMMMLMKSTMTMMMMMMMMMMMVMIRHLEFLRLK